MGKHNRRKKKLEASKKASEESESIASLNEMETDEDLQSSDIDESLVLSPKKIQIKDTLLSCGEKSENKTLSLLSSSGTPIPVANYSQDLSLQTTSGIEELGACFVTPTINTNANATNTQISQMEAPSEPNYSLKINNKRYPSDHSDSYGDSQSDLMSTWMSAQTGTREKKKFRKKNDENIENNYSATPCNLSLQIRESMYEPTPAEAAELQRQPQRRQLMVAATGGEMVHDRNENIEIIIEPAAECADSYFANPLKIYRLMQKSLFGHANIVETNRNLRKKIQTIKLANAANLAGLLAITNIGEYSVKCYEPLLNNDKIGIIGPIELEVTPAEVVTLLGEAGYPNCRAERLILGYGKNARTTKTIKIWFTTIELPDCVYLMMERFQVSLFVGRPWQCFKCQSFGHNAKSCTYRARCVICAGEHALADCPNKESEKKDMCKLWRRSYSKLGRM
jgi:hypothetical protein